MAAKPAVLPEVYNGDGNWDEWITHFKDIAEIKGWENVAKLRWLKVRFTGRAQRAFQRLPDVKKADFQTAIKSMQDRFEPASKKSCMQSNSKPTKREAMKGGQNSLKT